MAELQTKRGPVAVFIATTVMLISSPSGVPRPLSFPTLLPPPTIQVETLKRS